MGKPLLGCIADDFTGGTDLASTLVQGGMRTVQFLDVPEEKIDLSADAIVIALKTRTCSRQHAIEQSLRALAYLQEAGCEQFFFKYCSTFDSTDEGNIGPVADALMEALGIHFSIVCPAFPKNRRTVYKGHLFVDTELLNESSLRNHPLTPMTDANLVRVLGRQTDLDVVLCEYEKVEEGSALLKENFDSLSNDIHGYAIVDALNDDHLANISEAAADLKLITGASGVAQKLPSNFVKRGKLMAAQSSAAIPLSSGNTLILSGSCSRMTNRQVSHWAKTMPSYRLDPIELAASDDRVVDAIKWAKEHIKNSSILLYASADPDHVKETQRQLGKKAAGMVVENALARIAQEMAKSDVDRFVVAGGETSGTVVKALGVKSLRIGPEIAPGVPWTTSASEPVLSLALKSGNFGTEDFFNKAVNCCYE